jgi:hypothetical protein
LIDPKTCREHAMQCAELANSTPDLQLQSPLFDMAAKWVAAAADLEQMTLDGGSAKHGAELAGAADMTGVADSGRAE